MTVTPSIHDELITDLRSAQKLSDHPLDNFSRFHRVADAIDALDAHEVPWAWVLINGRPVPCLFDTHDEANNQRKQTFQEMRAAGLV